MKQTVCAVVVTFNRLSWLERCIEALRAQSRPPDAIIVVNNGSTDETAAWLGTQKDLISVTQPNSGSAGGQNTGINLAFMRGYDWIWCMDDDGRPDQECLRHLLDAVESHGIDIVNPLVLDCNQPDQLAFELPQKVTSMRDVTRIAEDGLVRDIITPFNGTLIHRRVIEKVGNVKWEMFIWGDEIEFICRAKRAGFKVATPINALHYHPVCRNKDVEVFGGRGRIALPEGTRGAIYYRNLGYIQPRYHGAVGTVKLLTKYLYYFLFRDRARWTNLVTFLRYFLDGALDRYKLPPQNVANRPPA